MENILKQIKVNGSFSLTYRIVIDDEPNYVNLKAVKIHESDGEQLIIGLSNINEQVKRDQEYLYNLSIARNEANIDVLTGVKNKHAYVDIENQMNNMIEEGQAPEFAVAVLDLNGLKLVNDTKGHQAGDEFIRRGCSIICSIFRHSPVYRVGGDEFAVICQGRDYRNIDLLMTRLAETNEKNASSGNVVIAGGMSLYQGDGNVAAVFERADVAMYENKKKLKESCK
jgi:diguanylate cyclase (GGDEF)-like protein